MNKENFVEKLDEILNGDPQIDSNQKNYAKEMVQSYIENYLSGNCSWTDFLNSLRTLIGELHNDRPLSYLRDAIYLNILTIAGDYVSDLEDYRRL